MGATHLFKFDANKFVRQDCIQRSLRTAFQKRGQPSEHVKVKTAPRPVAQPKQEPATATTTEVLLQQVLKELQDLRALHSRTTPVTVINNNNNSNNTTNNTTLILNFGQEDMSYLRPPVEYLEKTFEGMRELLNDVYFNDDKPQNHTIRINMRTRTAEASDSGGWKPIELPRAATNMLDKCRFYMISGYDGDRHKNNDNVMDFTCSLGNNGDRKREPLKAEIHHKLLTRARLCEEEAAAVAEA